MANGRITSNYLLHSFHSTLILLLVGVLSINGLDLCVRPSALRSCRSPQLPPFSFLFRSKPSLRILPYKTFAVNHKRSFLGLQNDPCQEPASDNSDNVFEDNKLQSEGGLRESSLDTWMIAYNSNKEEEKTVEFFGDGMEDVLKTMEKNGPMDVDAYATVIHVYLAGKKPCLAMRVLGNMENQLTTQQIRHPEDSSNRPDNRKLRLIQYNRVLQGLVRSPDKSHGKLAFRLLVSMCLEEKFETHLIECGGGVFSFTPKHLAPSVKSFVMVLEYLLSKRNESKRDEAEADAIYIIKKAKEYDASNDYLLRSMVRAVGGDREYIDYLVEKS